MSKQYGMVIDLQKCVGCGCCTMTCKTENNTQARANGQTFNWSDIISREEGKFPNPSYTAIPVLCNHCSDAPCVKACPVQPKSMFKTADGITMHNDERCIGCRRCRTVLLNRIRRHGRRERRCGFININCGGRDG